MSNLKIVSTPAGDLLVPAETGSCAADDSNGIPIGRVLSVSPDGKYYTFDPYDPEVLLRQSVMLRARLSG